jgi:NAD(P) transhydrogenase subunit alpha
MEFNLQEITTLLESILPHLYLLILAIFLGIEVIGRVPQVLHTPLMSGSNALSGVVVIGSMLTLGYADDAPWPVMLLACVSLVLATINVVGGFAVTARMLNMFRKKK